MIWHTRIERVTCKTLRLETSADWRRGEMARGDAVAREIERECVRSGNLQIGEIRDCHTAKNGVD